MSSHEYASLWVIAGSEYVSSLDQDVLTPCIIGTLRGVGGVGGVGGLNANNKDLIRPIQGI